jgi:CubicO group peptidase (beta-lactamase class C family)
VRRREFLINSCRSALGVSLLSLTGGATLGSPSADGRRKFLQSKTTEWERGIPGWLRETRLPGASMVLIDGGKIVWQREFGVRDAVSKRPVERSTVFAACSNTKPVFAYAVIKLCEKGVLDLDTPLTRYTSKRIVADDPRLDLITARHVFNHTTGFPNWAYRAPLTIQFTPGTKVQYSGEGFRYLQTVVEELTRQPFPEFMRVNILEPFGMTSSRIVEDAAYQRRVATPHDDTGTPIKAGPPMTPAEQGESMAIYGAAASLRTTPSDYAKFLLEIIDPKPADAFRLNARSREDYLRPQVTRSESTSPVRVKTSSALSWVVAEVEGFTFFTHGGSASGWYCEARASVGRKSGVIVMTNGDNFPAFQEKLKLDLEFHQNLFAV